MFFSIINPGLHSPHRYAMKTIFMARRIIICYPMRTEELRLEIYLQEHFGIGLKQCCLDILQKCKCMMSSTGSLMTVITDPKLDKLAKLITYGNDEVFGSNILKDAFKSKPI